MEGEEHLPRETKPMRRYGLGSTPQLMQCVESRCGDGTSNNAG